MKLRVNTGVEHSVSRILSIPEINEPSLVLHHLQCDEALRLRVQALFK